MATLTALAGEFFHQGNYNDGADDVRPEFPDDQAAKCTDEQPGDPVLVTVRVKHQDCCGSVLPTPTPNSCSPVKGYRIRCRGWIRGSMVTLMTASQSLSPGHDVVFPSG